MKFVPAKVTRIAGRQLLQTQKSSPTLLFGAGVVGVVATTVLACRATLKVEEVLQVTEADLRKINLAKDVVEYSDLDAKRDKALVYARAAGSLGKLYWPAILCGVASIGALTSSHNILTKRNAALTAAYAAVEKGFAEYRQRVINDLGDEKDREYRFGPLEKCEIDDESKPGKKKTVRVASHASVYARFFDDRSPSFNQNPEYNVLFLRCQQNWANDQLRMRGHVFLNEVYDSLGLERSTEGAVVGWIRDAKNGDGHIDFGIFDGPADERFYDFVTGREGAVLLDFNVDGVIYDKI